MRQDISNPASNPASRDALSLFGHEGRLSAAPPREDASLTSPVVETPGVSSEYLSAPSPLSGDADTMSADPTGAISLNRIADAGTMRFVEGIAVVQALCAAVKDKGGVRAGMPDLNGVFLKNSGEIVAVSPTTGEPAARELARLLHRLVPAESTPPVGRLFVDRWTSGASSDLAEFSSELGYFARPNGRELLMGLHARIPPDQSTPATTPLPLPDTRGVAARAVTLDRPKEVVEAVRRRERNIASWLRSHRRQIAAAAAMVAIAIVATGLVTWFWPSKTAEAAQQRTTNTGDSNPAVSNDTQTRAPEASAPPTSSAKAVPKATSGSRTPAPKAGPQSPTRSSRVTESLRAFGAPATPSTTAAVDRQAVLDLLQLASVLNDTATAASPSRHLPDVRIYSATDSGVDPPKLRSAEIPEFLITGFPNRANSVEVIVDRSGGVERVRMLDGPQRIPDIMLLSRVKQWEFDPATKDGSAVRYRLILSWKVTP